MEGKGLLRLRRLGTAAACLALVVWVSSLTARGATAVDAAAEARRQGDAVLAAVAGQLGLPHREAVPVPVALVIGQSPLLLSAGDRVVELRRSREADEAGAKQEEPPAADPVREEPVEPEPPEQLLLQPDNGVPARTLVPTSPKGYVVWGDVYIDNRSDKAIAPEDLAGPYALAEPSGGPQVLIVHTHGSEAYTMPPGQEYDATSEYRTTDTACNVVRVGAEIRAVLEQAGLQVVQDTALHDYPQYSGAYDRSLSSIETYLERWPTVSFVLDIHRDAVTDSAGNSYKVVSHTPDARAAQMTFVVGTDGGGLEHPHWQENLRLAAAVQQRLLEDFPTLMRPITVRNSRYNQHAAPGCLLVEMGAAGNSLDEALVSARLLGKALAQVLTGQPEGGDPR